MTGIRSKLVGLLFGAWNDMDRVVEGLTPRDALHQADGGSSFAWTLAHAANQVDNMMNVRFQQRAPHDYIGRQRFRMGGPGEADDWAAVQEGVREVRKVARKYLMGFGDEDLGVVIAYDGSSRHPGEAGISLRHALFRSITHHYFHIGEIASKRDRLGHDVGDYPGPLEASR